MDLIQSMMEMMAIVLMVAAGAFVINEPSRWLFADGGGGGGFG